MINEKLPPNQRAAYFELALHPAKACANLTELYIAAARNALYAAQGRVSANAQAQKVRVLFARDQALSDEYNKLLGGKWDHMMDQLHIGYTSWNDPKTNVMPEVKEITPKQGAYFGVAVEGSETAWPGGSATATLRDIDTLGDQHRWIDVFGRGTKPSSLPPRLRKVGSSWTKHRGYQQRCRLRVSIDWKAAPPGGKAARSSLRATMERACPLRCQS